jgi:energy-coupling factor transporter ATP-binding protein EcfA2
LPCGRQQWNIGFKGRFAQINRIIWQLFNGKIPDGFVVDHIDGNSLNNKIENLRIKPFAIRYLEESENDKPFTLTSKDEINIKDGEIVILYGPSGSGKSFIAGNITKHAQLAGYHILYLDSEHAIDVDYLSKIGCSVDPEHLTYISVATIEDVNAVLSEFFSSYMKTYGKDNESADVPRTLIVLDSLAMLSSSTEMENYDKGVIKGDQGQLAKRRKAMLRLATGYLGRLPIAMRTPVTSPSSLSFSLVTMPMIDDENFVEFVIAHGPSPSIMSCGYT